MASITIRNLEDDLKRRLRISAAEHERSRVWTVEGGGGAGNPREVVTEPAAPRNLATAIRSRVAALGGVELDLPRRDPMRQPPHFPGKQG